MGFAVARAVADAGADVTLVAGPVNLATPPRVSRVDVESAQQMFDAAMQSIGDTDIYVGAAAISDYRPKSAEPQKIKKSAETFRLEMVKSPDLLANVAALENGPFTVGFAAETEKLVDHARAKLKRKGCDWIVANDVSAENGVFGGDINSVVLVTATGEEAWPKADKAEVAARLVERIAQRFETVAV